MSENTEEQTIEIVEAPVVEEVKLDLSVVDEKEQQMAKDLGIVPKEEVAEKKVVTETKKKQFEDIEKDESLVTELTKPDAAMYFKWKGEKKARQDAQTERDHVLIKEKALRTELEKAKEEGTLTVRKLDSINKLLNGPQDDITIEAIQEILAAQPAKQIEDKNKPLTKADLEQLRIDEENRRKAEAESNDKFVNRVKTLEEYGKTTVSNYDEVVLAAKEVIDGKVDLPKYIDRNDLARRLVDKVSDANADQDDVVEFIVDVAKLNPNYGKEINNGKPNGEAKEVKKVSSEDIDKIVKNAAKSQSSASIPGGNSRRTISVNDITLEEAANLPFEQYNKLPKEVRDRLKREAM